MRTLRIFLALLALAAGVSTGRAQSFTAPITGGGGGTVTGSVWFPGPFSVSGTNWYLNSSISNLALAPALTNASMVYSNTIVVNAGPDALVNGAAMTNAVKLAGTLASGTRQMLVVMSPGDYYTPTNTLPSVMMAVDNVSTYWQPGAKWMSGRSDANGDTAFMWDDQAGKRTNVHVYGHGDFYLTNHDAAVVSLESGSKMRFQGRNAYASDGTNATGGAASVFNFLTTAADFEAEISDSIYCDTYDALYFSAAEGHKVKIRARRIASKFGDILETTGTAANYGDVVIEADLMERTATTEETLYGATYRPQPSFLKLGGNVIVKAKAINCYSTNGVIYSGNTTNYGMIQDAVITVATNSSAGIVGDGSASGTAQTGVRFKNCTLIGPWGVDALNLTNLTALPTILDNCTIYPGNQSTNWARGITPSGVVILGGLNLYPWKPSAANITVLGTNTIANLDVLGITKLRGAAYASNNFTVGGDVVAQSDFYGVGSGFFNALTITNVFYVPFLYTGAAADGAGSIHQRSNAWATGRGTLIFNDQTADVLAVATLASDTPSNGQVPVWNTGGTITWETQSGSGGGGTNFANVNLLLGNTNAALSAGVQKAFFQSTNASFTQNYPLAVPESGYKITQFTTNSGTSDIVLTINTNGVAANPFSIREKTNINTITIPSKSVVKHELTYAGSGLWLLSDVEGPQYNQIYGTGVYPDTNGVSGLDITISTLISTNYANAATNDLDCSRPLQAAFTNDLSGAQLIRLLTPRIGTWGNVYMRDSGTARTIGVAVPAGVGHELLSTNWTSNSTNILTVASKLAVFSYEVTRGTNGTTNVSWFVTSKTP